MTVKLARVTPPPHRSSESLQPWTSRNTRQLIEPPHGLGHGANAVLLLDQTGEGHAVFRPDLLKALGWEDLHLLTLLGASRSTSDLNPPSRTRDSRLTRLCPVRPFHISIEELNLENSKWEPLLFARSSSKGNTTVQLQKMQDTLRIPGQTQHPSNQTHVASI